MFYRGHSNIPKFKNKNDKHSYTTSHVNNNIRIMGNKVRLPKIGFVKVRGMRTIPTYFKIKRAIVFEDKKGKFYISIVFEFDEVDKKSLESPYTQNINVVGLDFKIGNIFVSSDNFIPKYNNNYFTLINKVPIFQRALNRKVKFSKNYYRAINKLRHIHRKIVSIRQNMLNQISKKLSESYNFAIVEGLSIKEIVHKLGNGKNTYNTSFNTFIKKLSYKLNNNIVKIDKWFPSSKKCCKCGKKKKHLKLSQKIYKCSFCNNVIDRDLNAAINIRNEGMKILKIN